MTKILNKIAGKYARFEIKLNSTIKGDVIAGIQGYTS